LQVFHMDIVKIARDVAHVAMVVYIRCKRPFKCFICFFRLMFQVCLFGCCICFTHMLQVYVLNISSASDVCCIQVVRVTTPGDFKALIS